LILKGDDVFAQAETGSGKTGAFAIPIIQKVINENENLGEKVQYKSLILSPTRELAIQTFKAFEQFGSGIGIKCASIIGGESINKQKEILSQDVHILIGTPGRICDLVNQKKINLSLVKSIIFDEADRLFDMGFKKEIEAILRKTPKSRQLIMLSATTNMDVLETAYRFHSRPTEISLSTDSLLVDNIDHKIAMLSDTEKFPFLVNLLRKREDFYAIIFCNTQIKTHEIAHWLRAMKFKASPISGRLSQSKRNNLMEQFKSKEIMILVCTDVAARGLDIKDVNLVINYDLPGDAANYVHRIGRTGRAGESGEAISLCGYKDCENLDAITELIESKIPKMDIDDNDFATDICDKPKIDLKSLETKRKDHDKKPREKKKYEKKDHNKIKETKNSQKKRKERIPMTFEITTTSYDAAANAAKNHFKLDDLNKLNHNIVKKGSKRFLFFGPQEVTYEFFIQGKGPKKPKNIIKKTNKPQDKKRESKKMSENQTELNADQLKIKNITNEFIDKLQVDIERTFTMSGDTLNCELTGDDVGLFLTNRKQLLFAVETLIRQFIFRNEALSNDVKIRLIAKGTHEKKNFDKKGPKGPRRKNTNYEDSLPDTELEKMANELKDLVLETGQDQLSKPLNPKERRIIHTTLQDLRSIETESMGDGRLKQVRVFIKNI
jgi:ATP-dependent RNA helicase RhlE